MTSFNYSKLATLKPKTLEDQTDLGSNSVTEKDQPALAEQETGRPIGHPFEERTPAPDARYRTPDLEERTPDLDATGRPLIEQIGRPIREETDARSKSDKRQKKRLTIRYNAALEKEIRDFCSQYNLEINDLHELAIISYMESVKERTPGQTTEWAPGITEDRTPATSHDRTPHDDLKIIYRSDDNIIMLFEQITGRKWSAQDDREGAKFNKVDLRLIEIAMLTTRLQSRRPRINSFKYFVPEIEFHMSAGISEQNLNVNVRRIREKFAKWKEEGKKKA
jgi:hypothetical protein